ncbi:hypothetical protein [Lysinibacillus xylanilyticus]|uniref:hypothetical protein n=1 Tax=Lysinibacillus xylanilyticus TaxID=582475 RepID=UPI003D06AADF
MNLYVKKKINSYKKMLLRTFNEDISKQTQTIESKFESIEASLNTLNAYNTELSKKKEDSSTFNLNYNNHQIDIFVKFNNTFLAYYIKIFCILSFLFFLVRNFITSVKETPDINFNLADIQLSFDYSNMNFDLNFYLYVLGAFLINVFIAFISHMIIFNATIKNTRQESNSEDKNENELNHISSKDLVNQDLLKPPCKVKKYISKFKTYLLFLFSPDLFFANSYKTKLKSHVQLNEKSNLPTFIDNEKLTISHWNTIKIYYQNFIIKSNWLNICISIIATILIVCLTPKNIEIMQFIFICVFIRLISRGLEISIAFYKDIVNVTSKLFLQVNAIRVKKDNSEEIQINILDSKYINGFKSSLLREGARLSLAVHSLLELFITFALAFYLLFNILSLLDNSYFLTTSSNPSIEIEYKDEKMYIKRINEEEISISAPNYVETFLFSSSLGLFNISYVTYQNILISILHFYQVLLSAILILLSIARYLNNDKLLSPQDERLYKITALKNYNGTEDYLDEKLEYKDNSKSSN